MIDEQNGEAVFRPGAELTLFRACAVKSDRNRLIHCHIVPFLF